MRSENFQLRAFKTPCFTGVPHVSHRGRSGRSCVREEIWTVDNPPQDVFLKLDTDTTVLLSLMKRLTPLPKLESRQSPWWPLPNSLKHLLSAQSEIAHIRLYLHLLSRSAWTPSSLWSLPRALQGWSCFLSVHLLSTVCHSNVTVRSGPFGGDWIMRTLISF